MHPRWIEIRKTSPSGKTMFVCQSCGQSTPAPSEECRNRVFVLEGTTKFYMPCSVWPTKPEESLQQLMLQEGTDCYFSGTIRLSDGGKLEVSVPVPEEIAKKLVCVAVEYDLQGNRKRAMVEAAERSKMDAVYPSDESLAAHHGLL